LFLPRFYYFYMYRRRYFYHPLIFILASRPGETAEYGLFVELFFYLIPGVEISPTLNFSLAGVWACWDGSSRS